MHFKYLLLAFGLVSTQALAGPFAPAAGKSGTTAISKDDVNILGWASGYESYLPGADLDDAWKKPAQALGKAEGTASNIVSLGNGGSIVLTFDAPISNGTGADFAVFENAFGDTFLELAFVEVSSDGVHFFRFQTISYTPNKVSAFGSTDPTNIEGFAGKYRAGFGTPFDLDLLKGNTGLDVDSVTHIRLVDVIGDGRELDDFPTAFGRRHPIYDPYKTTGSAGFDLDAIAVLHFAPELAIPEPSSYALLMLGLPTLLATRRNRWRQTLAA